MIVLCGLLWPLEGMPQLLRDFALLLPFTIPTISVIFFQSNSIETVFFQLFFLFHFSGAKYFVTRNGDHESKCL